MQAVEFPENAGQEQGTTAREEFLVERQRDLFPRR